jgi:hypothetical protein
MTAPAIAIDRLEKRLGAFTLGPLRTTAAHTRRPRETPERRLVLARMRRRISPRVVKGERL